MSTEEDFINTWIHIFQDEPNTIVVYETWSCTSEDFINHHLAKPYSQAYKTLLPELLAGDRRLEFLEIIGIQRVARHEVKRGNASLRWFRERLDSRLRPNG